MDFTATGQKIDIDYEYEKYPLKDYVKNRAVFMDVNWNSAVAPVKMIRFSFEDDHGKQQQLTLNRAELQTLMFLLAPSEEEVNYLRSATADLKRKRHQFRVKARRNIQKGEDVIISKNIT